MQLCVRRFCTIILLSKQIFLKFKFFLFNFKECDPEPKEFFVSTGVMYLFGYPLVSNKIENLPNELRGVKVTFSCSTSMNRMCQQHLISLWKRVVWIIHSKLSTKEVFVLEWNSKSGAYYIKVIKVLKSTFEIPLRYQTKKKTCMLQILVAM